LTLGDFSLLDEKPRRPFDAYFRTWLETYVKAHCKERTRVLYLRAFEQHLLPRFGQKDIGTITREEVKQLAYDLLAQQRSRGTVKGVLAPLREMFNHAIEDGHATINPALRILKRSRTEEGEPQRKASFLTKEELGLLLRTCQEYFPDYYPFVSLLARTGLRLGEAIALQWDDIDFHGRFIEVKHTWGYGRLTVPKSGKGRRVDMSTQLTETLRALLLERKKETLRNGRGEVPPWVFMSEWGNPRDAATFRSRVWSKILKRAGLHHIRIHDLRHTFASLLIQNGESLAYVKEQLGHHSIQITVDTYGYLVPGGNRQAVDKLDGLENANIRNLDATNTLNTVSRRGRSA
jgi:integrase